MTTIHRTKILNCQKKFKAKIVDFQAFFNAFMAFWKSKKMYELDFPESRADSRFVPSQWETALLCNDVCHWLGVILESAQRKGLISKHFSNQYGPWLSPWYICGFLSCVVVRRHPRVIPPGGLSKVIWYASRLVPSLLFSLAAPPTIHCAALVRCVPTLTVMMSWALIQYKDLTSIGNPIVEMRRS